MSKSQILLTEQVFTGSIFSEFLRTNFKIYILSTLELEPEPVLRTGSGQKVPAPAGSGSATLFVG